MNRRIEDRKPTAIERRAAERGERFLRMYAVDGLTYERIAEAEGISVRTVTRIIRAARDRREKAAA